MKAKPFSGLLLLLTTLTLVSFKSETKTSVNCLLIVGVAHKDLTCSRSDGNAVFFPTVLGSYSIYSRNPDNYYNNVTIVKNNLHRLYKVADKNITIHSSEMPEAVTIQYKQKAEGWNCYVYKFIVGFGETEEMALADAIKQKNDAVGESTPYTEKGTVSCLYKQ